MRRPFFQGPARTRAVKILEQDVELFQRAGCTDVEWLGPLAARFAALADRPALRIEMAPQGKVFGGIYGLEISTDDPVLPRTRGLSGRGRGVARLRGVAFRARRGDEAGQRLADVLERDRRLVDRLGKVHFEKIRVDPEGRPVIRHMGGSLVWFLFPPLIKGIPLVAEQVKATIAALEAFAAAGR